MVEVLGKGCSFICVGLLEWFRLRGSGITTNSMLILYSLAIVATPTIPRKPPLERERGRSLKAYPPLIQLGDPHLDLMENALMKML